MCGQALKWGMEKKEKSASGVSGANTGDVSSAIRFSLCPIPRQENLWFIKDGPLQAGVNL